jgi:peptidoglycan hydrolase CwlO-like protein
MPTQKLDRSILEAAVIGFEQQRQQIDAKIAELKALLSGGTTQTAATPQPAKRKRRKMSAAGRKAIAEAQRKRWAASKKAAEPSAPEAAPKAKRKLSKAGRAAIVAATKKRWAAVRAAKAS